MPAMVCHWLLGQRVLDTARECAGEENFCENSFLAGCQGPDVLFYHRLASLRQRGNLQRYGSRIHSDHPSALFACVKDCVRESGELYAQCISYALGLCCHYAYDICAHPYVCQLTEYMCEHDERGGGYKYHAFIESALDVILLRHETGGLISDFPLARCARFDAADRRAAAFIYGRVLADIYGAVTSERNLLRLLPDMRRLFRLLYDPTGIWRPLVSGAERLAGISSGAMSAFMRPFMEDDSYDYANTAKAEWVNCKNAQERSCEDFFELTDRAEECARDMMRFFMKADSAQEFAAYTGERSFNDNVPEAPASRDDCVI